MITKVCHLKRKVLLFSGLLTNREKGAAKMKIEKYYLADLVAPAAC